MSAEIVDLSARRLPPSGNGALEVVRDYLTRVHPARTMARLFVESFEELDVLPDADHFLAWLWEQGFKIEPLE